MTKFNTKSLKNMDYMFSSCTSLTSLYIVWFNTLNVDSFTEVFEGDEDLELYVYPNDVQNLLNSKPYYVKFHRVYNFDYDD